MSSPHAINMQERGRRLLERRHEESVSISENGATRTVKGIWKRIMPEGGGAPDGIGAQGYEGTVEVVVHASDFNAKPGPNARVIRNGETWAIRHVEPIDEWKWKFHLARPDSELRMPSRVR